MEYDSNKYFDLCQLLHSQQSGDISIDERVFPEDGKMVGDFCYEVRDLSFFSRRPPSPSLSLQADAVPPVYLSPGGEPIRHASQRLRPIPSAIPSRLVVVLAPPSFLRIDSLPSRARQRRSSRSSLDHPRVFITHLQSSQNTYLSRYASSGHPRVHSALLSSSSTRSSSRPKHRRRSFLDQRRGAILLRRSRARITCRLQNRVEGGEGGEVRLLEMDAGADVRRWGR